MFGIFWTLSEQSTIFLCEWKPTAFPEGMRTLYLYQTLLIPSLHSKIPNSAAILKTIAMQLRGARWPGVFCYWTLQSHQSPVNRHERQKLACQQTSRADFYFVLRVILFSSAEWCDPSSFFKSIELTDLEHLFPRRILIYWLRTSNFQGATTRPIVPRHKHYWLYWSPLGFLPRASSK